MFGSNDSPNGFGTFTGPNGSGTVFRSGNTAWVSGTNGHDGLYTSFGNTVMGPQGPMTVTGAGSTKTVFGPNGVSTVLGSSGVRTVIGPDGSTTTLFGN